MLWMVFLLCVCSAVKLTIYNNARFVPTDIRFLLNIESSISSQIKCACRCSDNDMCLTAIYSDIDHNCTLFSAILNQGKLQVVVTSSMTSVITFKNKTLPGLSEYSETIMTFAASADPTKLTNGTEIVYGIWNTIAGGNSNAASSGSSAGNYAPGCSPSTVLDGNLLTYYSAYGTCSAINFGGMTCGQNTGLYLSLFQGSSMLAGFKFYGSSVIFFNPLTVTIEGSNAASAALTLGSSWTLLYNGSCGLDFVLYSGQSGTMQWLSNNSIWYSSYRILVTSKGSIGNFVSYTELELCGYS